jgi:hypothetical protein
VPKKPLFWAPRTPSLSVLSGEWFATDSTIQRFNDSTNDDALGTSHLLEMPQKRQITAIIEKNKLLISKKRNKYLPKYEFMVKYRPQ